MKKTTVTEIPFRAMIATLFMLVASVGRADFDVYNRNYQQRVYPDTVLSAADIVQPAPGNTAPLVLRAAPGEVEPVSMVLKPDVAVGDFDVTVSDLVSATEVIPSANIRTDIIHNQKMMPTASNGGASIINISNSWGVYAVGSTFHFYTKTAAGWKDLSFRPVQHRWIHVTATYDGTEMRLYLDGGNTRCGGAGYCSRPQNGDVRVGGSTLDIGAFVTAGRYFYDGLLDELAVSNTVKDEVAVGAYFAACKADPLACAANGNVAVWPFNEGAGNQVQDIVGQLDGTMLGNTDASHWGAGKSGQAFRFDGTGNAVGLSGSTASMGITDKLTVEFWLKPSMGFVTPRVMIPQQIYKNEFGSSLVANSNTWIWLTVEVPDAAVPGVYAGVMTVTVDGQAKNYPLQLTVVPVVLQTPVTPTPSVYYTVLPDLPTTLNTVTLLHPDQTPLTEAEVVEGGPLDGQIDQDEKTWWFIRQQLADLAAHGLKASPNLVFRAGKTPPPFLLSPTYVKPGWVIDYTNLERFMDLLALNGLDSGKFTFWDLFAQIAQGAINDEASVSNFTGFTSEFETAFEGAVVELRDAWQADWPPLIGEVWDEPISADIAQANALLQMVRKNGVTGITHLNGAINIAPDPDETYATQLYPNLDIGEAGRGAVNTPFLDEMIANNVEPWVYNMNSMWFVWDTQYVLGTDGKYDLKQGINDGEERLVYGHFLDRLYQEKGVQAAVQFIYGYYTKAQWGEDGDVIYPKFQYMNYWNEDETPSYSSQSLISPYGMLPTINWEWTREGVDDSRYIHTLRQKITIALTSGDSALVARANAAQAVLDGITALAGNKLAEGSSVDPLNYSLMQDSMTNTDPLDDSMWPVQDYDVYRRTIADEIMKLSESDGDGLTDYDEFYVFNTNAFSQDTDGDGVSDIDEISYDGDATSYNPLTDTNPQAVDTDGDGLSDLVDPVPLDFNFNDGDLAPLGSPDGVVNAADYLIAMRIALGLLSPTATELAHGDLYPVGAPDGVITLADIIQLLKLM